MMKKLLAMLLCAVMLLSLSACGVNPNDNVQSDGTDSDYKVEVNEIAGEVNVAVFPNEAEVYEYVFNSKYFKAQYPNIKITVTPWSDEGSAEWLTTQATNGNLPDIMLDWLDITYPISQGWVYPITDYLAADEDSGYIPENLLDKYQYGGENYGIPYRYSIRTFALNTDMLDALNLDAPSYDWSTDDFKDILIKATSNTTSGINNIGWMEDMFLAARSKDGGGAWQYNKETNKVNLTNGDFVEVSNMIAELEQTPGLSADSLMDDALVALGQQDDYAKKFGDGVDAVADSKVLFANVSTWDYSWYKNYTFNFDFYPVPGAPGSAPNVITYTDHAFMTSTTKNPDAAFEVLKFLTYGEGAYLALLDYEAEQQAKGVDPSLWLPMSFNPVQVDTFEKLDYVPEGLKWMYNHFDTAVVGYFNKCIPGMTTCIVDYLNPAISDIHTGNAEAEAICVEVEQMANNYLAESARTFNDQLASVQAEFSANH